MGSNGYALSPPRYCSLIVKSTKFEPHCGPAGLPSTTLSSSSGDQQPRNGTVWPLLVTGTGRSGTKYMMKLLKELEFQVAHDDKPPLSDGAVSWVGNGGESSAHSWVVRIGLTSFTSALLSCHVFS